MRIFVDHQYKRRAVIKVIFNEFVNIFDGLKHYLLMQLIWVVIVWTSMLFHASINYLPVEFLYFSRK